MVLAFRAFRVYKVYRRISIKGDKGDKGDKPIAGIDYPLPKDGVNGTNGITTIINTNTNTGTTNGTAYSIDYGVIPNINTDQYIQLQRFIDSNIGRASKLIINAGTYHSSKGLLIRRGAIGSHSKYTQVIIEGEGVPYDANNGASTKIIIDSKDNFGIGLQGAKGIKIENLEIEGQNNLSLYTLYDRLYNPAKTFVENGCRDNRISPYAGIVIDLFGSAAIEQSNRYPGLEQYYTDEGGEGSTDVRIEGCSIHGFVVDICISPNSTTQNAEIITGNNNWLGDCKVGISTGNNQTRTCDFNNTHCWSPCLYFVDSYSYGQGMGVPANLTGNTNLAGGQRYLCRVGQWYTYINFTGVYAELLWAIGGCFEGKSVDMFFNNCQFYFAGEQVTPQGLIRMPNPIAQADNISINQSWFINYATNYSQLNFYANGLSISGLSRFSAPIVCTNGLVKLSMVTGMNGTSKPTDDILNPLIFTGTSSGAATVTDVDETNNTWTYHIANSTSDVVVGDFVLIYGKQLTGLFNNGGDVMIGAGNVKDVNAGDITVDGVPYQLAVGMGISAYTRHLHD